jgi:hypothetical protein
MRVWKINCMEHRYPGMWQLWYKLQCVAVGWPTKWYRLNGASRWNHEPGWRRVRAAMLQVDIGDYVVVALRGHRVGRLGQVTGKAINDEQWNPVVPPDSDSSVGEMGRRIFVRWEMTTGPDSRDMVVQLPSDAQLSTGELRPTLAQIRSVTLPKLRKIMNDPVNWVGLLTHFDYERALSGYIAAYPHRLEDGFLPHPSERVRERIFKDQSRSDVLLLDRNGVPVIVECKQGQPSLADIAQLRNYIYRLKIETKKKARGVLVHGGAQKLRREVRTAASKKPRIEIVQYKLDMEFARST